MLNGEAGVLKFVPVLQRGSLAVKRTDVDSFAQDLVAPRVQTVIRQSKPVPGSVPVSG